MNIKGAVTVVTGAGGGIGAALARKLRDEGAEQVVVCDMDAEAAGQVAADISGVGEQLDVADGTAVTVMIQRTLERFGRIDLFCSNAGITGEAGIEAADEIWERTFAVNVMAHVHVTRALVPAMLERGNGHIVLTASAAGVLSQPGDAPYTATKHATVGLAEWLAITYGGQGIGFAVLCPMGVATPMYLDAKGRDHEGANVVAASGNVVTPEEVAEAVVAGLHDECFLILPQPEVAKFMVRKATDPDRWLAGMRRLVERS